MPLFKSTIQFFLLLISLGFLAQNSIEDFEGYSTLNNWLSIDCVVKPSVANPVPQGINTSERVLKYYDYGGLWGNIYFNTNQNLHLAAHPEFTFKIYVPSSSITGTQNNQVTLKLQNSKITQPWLTQTIISKPIILNQWQVVTFNFRTDAYENFDAHSPAPIERRDFDRVLLQVNGENNTDLVVAYFDDFYLENTTPLPPPTVYDQLIWSDEFNTNGAIDSSKWFHQTIFPLGNSWFSGEIQHYTNRVDNSYVENGVLKVVAKKETFTDQGTTKQYTSARLNSKFAFTYGRVEFKAKLPTGIGTWPAIWMLGKNINEKGAYWQTQGFGTLPWPNCGEMDIMEHWGTEQNNVISAVHTPSTYKAAPGTMINSTGQFISTASTDFHIYALEWTEEKLEFSIDGIIHYTYQPANKNENNWPFDKELYLLINIAIQPSIDPNFTQSSLDVDYIRIYQQSTLSRQNNSLSSKIKAFPNPVKDEISLELSSTLNERIVFKIYNINGKLVYTKETAVVNGNAKINNLDFLQKGVYFLRYTKDDLHGIVKFLK